MTPNLLSKLLVKGALFGASFLLWQTNAQAQDPEFTQFYAAPIYTNPAFAGTGNCGGRIVLNYRNQWPSLPGTFRTFAGSYDQHIDAIGGGIGLMAMKDVAGDGLLTTTAFSGIYSYQINVSRKFTMRTAIQATYQQRSIDFDRLRFADQIVPRRGFVEVTSEQLPSESVSYPNFSAGVIGYTKNFYAGIAVHNLNEPNQSFYGNSDEGTTVPRRWTLHSGMVIPLKESRGRNTTPDLAISPNILIMMQEKFMQVNFGFYVNKGPLVAGLWFRQTSPNSDAMLVLVGFRHNQFKFGYSYDVTVSSARAAAQGSHEISAAIEWCSKKRPKRYRKLNCPDF
ncbi:MAG: type IX secretion system membrane protein PorP/SprF [Bacteroidota bacterium]|nr:type IX secretion system membrane protein PorP/SprF [Bacteroidota bacterium]MDX5431386.1 type IX secretion system membrane protein PorP/SprF [Bacteroidota bacterium]MDX5470116.1 type IX secretion system membrane protein PorP/SprF [Bacteroidota bacterium]